DPSPDVPDRVAPDEKAGILHPGGGELHRGGPLRRVQGPGDAALWERAALREVVKPSQESALVDLDELAGRERAHPSATSPPRMNRPRAGLVTASRSL